MRKYRRRKSKYWGRVQVLLREHRVRARRFVCSGEIEGYAGSSVATWVGLLWEARHGMSRNGLICNSYYWSLPSLYILTYSCIYCFEVWGDTRRLRELTLTDDQAGGTALKSRSKYWTYPSMDWYSIMEKIKWLTIQKESSGWSF